MSLGKYVKRMSSVFRREKQAKSSTTDALGAPSVPEVQEEATKDTKEDTAKEEAVTTA